MFGPHMQDQKIKELFSCRNDLRTKQHMSDVNFRAEIILHCPEGLIRDVIEMVPPGVLAGAVYLGCLRVCPSRVWGIMEVFGMKK